MTALRSASPDFLKERMRGLLGLPQEQEASQCTRASTQSTPGAGGRGQTAILTIHHPQMVGHGPCMQLSTD